MIVSFVGKNRDRDQGHGRINVMEQAIEVFAAIQLMIVGLSHIIRAGAWVDFLYGFASAGILASFYTAS